MMLTHVINYLISDVDYGSPPPAFNQRMYCIAFCVF